VGCGALEGLFVLILVAAGIFFVLVVPGLAIGGYRLASRLEREVRVLRAELRALLDRQATEDYQPHRPSHPVAEPGRSAVPPVHVQPARPEATPPQPVLVEPLPQEPEPSVLEPAARLAEPPASEPSPPKTAPEPKPRGLEQRLGARGFVWLGGVCLALAGAFLVKYSIDEGYLGPGTRIVLGILLGIALLVAGDFMRKRSGTIGQALTAAGVADLYASLFTATAYYHLVAPAFAFIVLAGLTFVAIGLALRHGPFVGLVGLAGGFITPAIVSTGEPNSAILFSYLYLLQLGSLWLERQRGWWYVPAVANAGGFGWALIIVMLPAALDAGMIEHIAVPVYLIVVAATVFWLSPRFPNLEAWPRFRIVCLISACASALVMLAWLGRGNFEVADWAFIVLLAVVGGLSSRLRPEHEFAGFALALAPMLGLLLWVTPRDLDGYLIIASILGALGTGGGYALMWGARRPEQWSLLSAAYGAVVLALAYWRLRGIDLLLPWSIVCLALSAIHLGFAERLRIWRQRDRGYRRSFGVHALACVAFLAAAVPLWVEREWLPVLWSLMLPLTAWIAIKIDEPWLRRGLWVAAPAVLIAVLVSGFPAGDRPIFNWLAYGLGVPTACFAATAWLARRSSDLRIMLLHQAGALILGFLLITLEIRHLFHGAAFKFALLGFAEAGTLVLVWGALALGAWRMAQRRGEARLRWIAYGLAVLAAALTIFGVWFAVNPLVVLLPVRGWPFLNTALYVFGTGFLLFLAMARVVSRSRLDSAHRRTTVALAAAIALIDGFLGITALNRHLFNGAYIGVLDGFRRMTDAELYGYTAAWLVYGGAMVVFAIWRRLPPLRYAAVGIVLLVVAKVLIIDTSHLTVLYRVASLLVIGLALLSLAYLYQRMVRRMEAA
jgi:uncharacterized membrane protein